MTSIQKRFKKNVVGPEAVRLLTPKQAAAYLGMSVDVIRDLYARRAIPYLMNGRKYLLDRHDLDKFIEKRKIQAR